MNILARLLFAPAIFPAYVAHGAYLGIKNGSGWIRGATIGSVFSAWYLITGTRLKMED